MANCEQKLPKRLIDPLQPDLEEALKLLSPQLESGRELVRRFHAGEDFPRREYDEWFTGFQAASERCFGVRSRIAAYFEKPPLSAAEAKERMNRLRQSAMGNLEGDPFLEHPNAALIGIDRLRDEVEVLESWVQALTRLASKKRRVAE